MWHSHPRLCTAFRTAEGGCATYQSTTDGALAVGRRGRRFSGGLASLGPPCRRYFQKTPNTSSAADGFTFLPLCPIVETSESHKAVR